MTAPRSSPATGRTAYADVPVAVHSWVGEQLGSPVVGVVEQSGGMPPGCATRVRCADGTRAFVKAVGLGLNADTPTLFRREADALGLIGSDPLWADLLASYDDGDWVGLLLEDVDGVQPDLTDAATADLVCAATERLGETIVRRVPHPPAPDPTPWPGTRALLDLSVAMRTWAGSFERALVAGLLPPWLEHRADDLRPGITGLAAGVAAGGRLVHWDVRDDNILVRPTGEVVFVDWGGCGVGAAWMDPLLVRLGRAHEEWFDHSVVSSPALSAFGDDAVTCFLAAFGSHLTWRNHTAVDVGLPKLAAFRRRHASRALAGVARRLGGAIGTSSGAAHGAR